MRGEVVLVVGIVAMLVGAGAGYLIGSVNEHTVTSTSTFVTTTAVTATAVKTMTAWSTLVIAGPPWLFGGAYANYTGVVSTMGQNYTEDVGIRVVQFNQTKVEYGLTYYYPSGYYTFLPPNASISTTRWLGISASPAYLLCLLGLGSPEPANVTVSGNQIAATSYACYVEGNDYGVVYMGWSVPFILSFSHRVTVTPISEEWTITSSNIPGLL